MIPGNAQHYIEKLIIKTGESEISAIFHLPKMFMGAKPQQIQKSKKLFFYKKSKFL